MISWNFSMFCGWPTTCHGIGVSAAPSVWVDGLEDALCFVRRPALSHCCISSLILFPSVRGRNDQRHFPMYNSYDLDGKLIAVVVKVEYSWNYTLKIILVIMLMCVKVGAVRKRIYFSYQLTQTSRVYFIKLSTYDPYWWWNLWDNCCLHLWPRQSHPSQPLSCFGNTALPPLP